MMLSRRRSGPNRKRCVDYFSSSSEDEDDDDSSNYKSGKKSKTENSKSSSVTAKTQEQIPRSRRNVNSILESAILRADSHDDDSVTSMPSSSSHPPPGKSQRARVSDVSSTAETTLGGASSPSWPRSSQSSLQSPLSHTNTSATSTNQILATQIESPCKIGQIHASKERSEYQHRLTASAESITNTFKKESLASVAVESLLQLQHQPSVNGSLELLTNSQSPEVELLVQPNKSREQKQHEAVDSAVAVKRVVDKWTTIPEKKIQQPPAVKRDQETYATPSAAQQAQQKSAPVRVSLLEPEPTPRATRKKRKSKTAKAVLEVEECEKEPVKETDPSTSRPPKKVKKQKQQNNAESLETSPDLTLVGNKNASSAKKKKAKDTVTAVIVVDGLTIGKIETNKVAPANAHGNGEMSITAPKMVPKRLDSEPKDSPVDATVTSKNSNETPREDNAEYEPDSAAPGTLKNTVAVNENHQNPRRRKKNEDAETESLRETNTVASQKQPSRSKKRANTKDAAEKSPVETGTVTPLDQPWRGKEGTSETPIPLTTKKSASPLAECETKSPMTKSDTLSTGKIHPEEDPPVKIPETNRTTPETKASLAEITPSKEPPAVENVGTRKSSSFTKQKQASLESQKSSEKNVKTEKKMSFQDQVLRHMLLASKPFTLKTLAAELQTTDTQLHHLMLSLTDKGIVSVKEFASQKRGSSKTLYWVLHEATKTKEIAAFMPSAEEIQAVKVEHGDLLRKQAALKQAIQAATSEISNEEMGTKLAAEEQAIRLLKTHLTEIKIRIEESKKLNQVASVRKSSLGPPPKSAVEFAREKCPSRLKVRINNMRSEWVKRKEKCMELIENLVDAMEKKPKDVIKMLEVETDEMEGVKLPPKQLLSPSKKIC